MTQIPGCVLPCTDPSDVEALPYAMSFDEGCPIEEGCWTVVDLLDSASTEDWWGCAADGALGPDGVLRFAPPIGATGAYHSCVVSTRLLTLATYFVQVSLDWAFAGAASNRTVFELRAALDEDWASAVVVASWPLSEVLATNALSELLPQAVLNADETRLAFCLAGEDASVLSQVDFDDLSVASPDQTCEEDADCAEPSDPCLAVRCFLGRCTEASIPLCCVDENDPDTPDMACNDDNPCTTDYCRETDEGFRCQWDETGPLGCCVTEYSCPDDGVQCTERDCDQDRMRCVLDGVADCLATSPYAMDFAEGDPVYEGEYESLADFGWAHAETGTNALDAGAWTLDDGALLGPDPYLSLEPASAATDFESCVVLPRLDMREGGYWAELAFHYAAEIVAPGTSLELRVALDANWDGAQLWTTPVALDATVAETAYTTGHIPVPLAIGDVGTSDQFQVALCVVGADSAAFTAVALDDIVLTKYTAAP